MKKYAPASKSSLFLMELISSILILSLCTTVCIRIFSASWQSRKQAREWNHIQECVTNAAEILEATDGSAESLLTYLPSGQIDNPSILYYYNSAWNLSTPEEAAYEMALTPSTSACTKQLQITFTSLRAEDPQVLYETEIRYPVFPLQDEEASDEKTE